MKDIIVTELQAIELQAFLLWRDEYLKIHPSKADSNDLLTLYAKEQEKYDKCRNLDNAR